MMQVPNSRTHHNVAQIAAAFHGATTASSPGPKCPDAFDVLVRITSPGSNVANDEIAAICSGRP